MKTPNSIWLRLPSICSILISALSFTGCQKLVEPASLEDFGLPKVELTIAQEELATLNSHVFARREVPARVEIAGERYTVLVRYSGQTSINRLKKSFTFTFSERQRFRQHLEYVMSAQTGDPTALHPIAGFWAFAQAGLLTPEVRPVAAYLNREFLGLYFLIEPIAEDFFRLRGQSLGSLYEAKSANAQFSFVGGYDVRLGFESRGTREGFYGDLEELLVRLDEAAPEQLPDKVERLLDVDNYLRYLAVSVLIHNWDGYFNNFRLHLDPRLGRFQFVPWDLDHTFELHPTRSNIRGANQLSERLLANAAYRARYRAILLELLEGRLTVEQLNAQIDATAEQLAPAYAADRFLAADGSTIFEHAARIKDFNRTWFAKIRQDLDSLK
ncbi:CotH kinase family protein [candidate division KSB1 bacterium]|nr:CotH kinase family protein [candidate division KSB1 bacterium]